MPKTQRELDNERAVRIQITTNDIHNRVTNIYECLCEREFEPVREEIKVISNELRIINKSIDDDEF